MTGRDVVSASLRKIGALASTETLAASEATDGLSELNRMIANWSTEGLAIFTRTREELVMTPGTAAYTMGAAGTFSSTRAIRLVEALIRDESNDIEHPVSILALSEWASIHNKDTQAPYPRSLYADGGYPLETVTLYPVPSAAHKLVLYSEKPLSSITTLDTTVSLPPGYEDALVYNLAVRLAPEYGKQVAEIVVMIANETKANIKRANRKTAVLACDEAVAGRTTFNIYTGGV